MNNNNKMTKQTIKNMKNKIKVQSINKHINDIQINIKHKYTINNT